MIAMKKLFAIVIIFLFIGVAIAPSINSSVVKASNDNDFVEVTSQAYGIQGFENTTVKLTKQQDQDLEQYLVDFRARLNQTTTREEAVPLFKDAVVELNRYGLLPEGMSVEQAQKLVTIGYQVQHAPNIFNKSSILNSTNYFCLFAGIFDNAYDDNIWSRLLVFFNDLYYKIAFPGNPLLYICLFFEILFGSMTLFKPWRFMNNVYVTGAVKFFFSVGLGGIKLGKLNISEIEGFTGLKIVLFLHYSYYRAFYLGFALNILDKN